MLADVIDCEPNLGNAIALTFDDGPAEWTEPILKTLDETRVRATFFVIGSAIEGREEILRRTASAGHEIGNHALSHINFEALGTPAAGVAAEIESTSMLIESVLGSRPRVFRPPGFGTSVAVQEAAGVCGFSSVVNASVFVNDWSEPLSSRIRDGILSAT